MAHRRQRGFVHIPQSPGFGMRLAEPRTQATKLAGGVGR